MNAERLVQLLDEVDEWQVYLHEAVQPAFLLAALVVAVAIGIASVTRSIALGSVALVAIAWAGLVARWALDVVQNRGVVQTVARTIVPR